MANFRRPEEAICRRHGHDQSGNCGGAGDGPSLPPMGEFSFNPSYAANIESTSEYEYDLNGRFDFGLGYNWVISAWPYITRQGASLVVMLPDHGAGDYQWSEATGVYAGPSNAILTYSKAAEEFRLVVSGGGLGTDGLAKTWLFDRYGRFTQLTVTGTANYSVNASLTSYGHPAAMHATLEDGTTLSYRFSYGSYRDRWRDLPYDVERLEGATFQRNGEDVERIVYAYHSDGSQGSAGDLKSATHQRLIDGAWIDMGTYYYSYYPSDESSQGFKHALKHALRPESYEQLLNDPAVITPDTATDEQLAEYATTYYEYSNSRVSKTRQSGGAESVFSYSDGDQSGSNTNAYKLLTIETRADGSIQITYTNHRQQVLLSEFRESTQSSERVIDYYQYDSNGNLTLHATPSALTGYTVNYDFTIAPEYRAENGQYEVGLIHVYEYYAETTTHQDGVGVKGSKKCDKIKQGRDGTEILLRQYEYTEHSATVSIAPQSIYPIAREILYRNEDGTVQIVTSYSYTWHPDTLKMAERVTTLAAVSAEQNGSGVSATRTEKFDSFGRLVWLKDERGFLTHHQYDAFGNLVQSTQDVDDALVAVPDGWATPAEGGKHLVTDYEYDSLGRVTQVLGPEHEAVIDGETLSVRTATWAVYKDAEREVWTAQGYANPLPLSPSSSEEADYAYWLVNPVSIVKSDIAGRTLESIQAVRSTSQGKLSASDSFPQSSYVRWTTNQYNLLGRLVSTRDYHTIPATGDGQRGTHYDQTDYGYDAMGRQNRTTSPGGTITRTVVNKQGQPIAVYVGTDDTGATDADPTGGATGPNNMVLVTEYEYNAATGCAGCGGGGGQGQLTALVQHVDAQTFRVTSYHYDWRNRQEYVVADADAEGRVTYARSCYDNLDRVVRTERYWQQASGSNSSSSSSSWDEDLLLARQETFYDDRGQIFRTRSYAVDELGQVGNYLEANTWYDAAGNPIKQQAAGTKAFTKTIYDSLGRAVKQYTGHDPDETTYAEATSVTDDTILEQTETVYNEVGSVLFVTARRRMHNATGTGELNNPSGVQPKARTSYLASWYDGLGRPIATANYGTGGGNAPVRSSLPPQRSDEVLVTTTVYNDRGEAFATTDPAGREDRHEFDALGRVVRTIQNYRDGLVDGQYPDEDVTVEKTYTADGQLLTLTAKNPATGDQVTRYVYGTTLADSAVARADLLRAEIHPDSDDTAEPLGNGADGVYDRVEYTYNRQGERTTKKDQNETVHAYAYDSLGRLIEDRVTVVGSGVDDQVRRIATRYTVRGQVERITSYDDPIVGRGMVLNEVQFVYNAFNQLVEDYQSHTGAVDMVTTPKVAYTYTDGSSGHVRLTQLVYPNGRILRYEYSSGTDAAINRVSFLADDDSGAVGTHLSEHTFLGLGQFAQVTYPEPNLRYDLAHGNGDDPCDGLDRFNRVVDLVWRDQTQGVDVERIQHGYDRAGNRLSRTNTLNHDLDETYEYDGLGRLTAWTLDGVLQKTWSLDPLGNDLSAGTYNVANEETPSQGSSGYDAAGNMTTLQSGKTAIYDAWNHLVEVTFGSGESVKTVERYEYDGTGRRIQIFSDFDGSTPDNIQDDYHSSQQVIESDITTAGSRNGGYQIVWSSRYIDAAVLRDTLNTVGTGIVTAERVFYLADANYNVTGLVKYDSEAGKWQAVERYSYTPYGVVTYRNTDWTTASSSANGNTTLYTGRTLDLLTGLQYNRARFYDARLKRFINRDPIGHEGSEWNLYEYARSSPLDQLDPNGLAITEQQCKDVISQVLYSLWWREIWNSDTAKRCRHPRVLCKCCDGFAQSKQEGTTTTITLCYNSLSTAGVGVEDLKGIVKHELIHAYDNCHGSDSDDCDSVACAEIRAYNWSGNCDQGGVNRQKNETKEECIKRSALASTRNIDKCKGYTNTQFAVMWGKCYSTQGKLPLM